MIKNPQKKKKNLFVFYAGMSLCCIYFDTIHVNQFIFILFCWAFVPLFSSIQIIYRENIKKLILTEKVFSQKI